MKTFFNLLRSGLARQWLTWLMIFALVPLSLGGLMAYLSSAESLKQTTYERLESIAVNSCQSIRLLEEVRTHQVQQVATRDAVRRALQNPTSELVDELQADLVDVRLAAEDFEVLYVMDRAGKIIASTDPEMIGESEADQTEFHAATRAAHVDSTFHHDAVTGKLFFDISAPVFARGGQSFWGVVTARLSTERLTTLIRASLHEETTEDVYLVDANYQRVTPPRGETVVSAEPIVTTGAQRALGVEVAGQKGDGTDIYTDVHGDEVYGAYVGIDEYGWAVLAEIEKSEALAPLGMLGVEIGGIGVLSVLCVFLAAVWLTRRFTAPVLTLHELSGTLAKGDLTRRSDLQGADEIGELGRSLDSTVGVWKKIISDLKDHSVRLSTTAAELAASSEELSRTATSQVRRLTDVSAATEEMATTIQQVAQNAETAARAAAESSRRAHSGARSMADTVAGLDRTEVVLKRLRQRSDEIGTIVNLIQEIAVQTNILSLNAAIEAAGAGEAGARFDVVAEEIRKLAGHTRQATGQIAELIHAVQSEAQVAENAMSEAARLAQQAGESLTAIVEASVSVADMMQLISASTEQQSQTSETIALTLEGIVAGSHETAAATRDTAQVGVELSNTAELLKEITGEFRLEG